MNRRSFIRAVVSLPIVASLPALASKPEIGYLTEHTRFNPILWSRGTVAYTYVDGRVVCVT